MTAQPQIKVKGAKEWGFVAHDTQMSETEADAALRTFWMFSNVQFMYTHSFW